MHNQQEYPTSSRLLHHDEFAFANAATTGGTTPSTQTMNMHTMTSSTQTNYVSDNQTIIYPMVQVVAPATLIAGYTFDVDVNHQIYTVTVVSIIVPTWKVRHLEKECFFFLFFPFPHV